MLAADRERYLPGDLLVKLDRATMAHSLEARSPFLDRDLVDFAYRLPDRFRWCDGHGKWLLKRAFEQRLPEGIPWRKKQGFGVPIERWLRAELGGMARELLVESPRLTAEIVDTRGVARLLDEHQAERKNNASRLWALLCLELWGRRRAAPGSAVALAPGSR
jgi:asparagine synthase (glutamine-hydrolysing)